MKDVQHYLWELRPFISMSVLKLPQLYKILLYSNQQYVAATHVAIFVVARTRAQPRLQCVRINPQLEIYIILIKFTVKKSILQIGIKY